VPKLQPEHDDYSRKCQTSTATPAKLDSGGNQDYMANGNLPFPFPDA